MAALHPTVRPLETLAQVADFYRLATDTFAGVEDVEERALQDLRYDDERPDAARLWRRGIVDGATVLAGYILHERPMRMGSTTLPTACLAAVVTRQEHRGRGLGRALMLDATEFAARRHSALLLLDGAPNFYHRFGYTDVLDEMAHAIAPPSIPAEAPSGHRVREARTQDADGLLELYNRHFGGYTGSFEWTPETMRHWLRFHTEIHERAMVVEDPGHALCGYLLARPGSSKAVEVAADSWPAALALLQHHASTAQDMPSSLWWQLPPDSQTLHLLADNLPGGSEGSRSTPIPPIQSRTRIQRDEGWMARPAHLPALIQGLLPVWHERWERSSRPYDGIVDLQIGDEVFRLTLGIKTLSVEEGGSVSTMTVHLRPQAFTQLVFGYRPVAYVAGQHGNEIPADVRPALEILFPYGGFWIPGRDAF